MYCHQPLQVQILSSSFQFFLAAITGGHGGGEALSAEAGLLQYLDVFSTIGYVLLVIAAGIFLLNKPIKKLMHGVE